MPNFSVTLGGDRHEWVRLPDPGSEPWGDVTVYDGDPDAAGRVVRVITKRELARRRAPRVKFGTVVWMLPKNGSHTIHAAQ